MSKWCLNSGKTIVRYCSTKLQNIARTLRYHFYINYHMRYRGIFRDFNWSISMQLLSKCAHLCSNSAKICKSSHFSMVSRTLICWKDLIVCFLKTSSLKSCHFECFQWNILLPMYTERKGIATRWWLLYVVLFSDVHNKSIRFGLSAVCLIYIVLNI